jgi:Pyridoxamine 5'-phosphate oxidase
MPKFFDSISDDLANWATRQPVFFTASAPLTGRHVNISPKGRPSATLAVLSPNSVAYIDATGSGSETIAHIYENGRVTVMFCSFGATPRILRFFCTGRVIEWDQTEFEIMLEKMGKQRFPAARAVILLDVFKVSLPPRSSIAHGADGLPEGPDELRIWRPSPLESQPRRCGESSRNCVRRPRDHGTLGF